MPPAATAQTEQPKKHGENQGEVNGNIIIKASLSRSRLGSMQVSNPGNRLYTTEDN